MLVLATSSSADEITQIVCRDGNNGPGNTVMFWVTAQNLSSVETNEAVQQLLNGKAQEVWQKCVSGGYANAVVRFIGIVSIAVPGNGNPDGAVKGVVQFGQSVWALTYFSTFEQTKKLFHDRMDAIAKKAQETADAKALSQKLQSDFKAQNAVELWVNPQLLKTNPFPYKGKVVGMIDTFQQMTGDGEAIFGGNFDVVAKGVPNTMFTQPGTAAVIAVQVDGLKQIQMLGTNMSVASGTFKGAYICKSPNCVEITGPQ
jgi:hypothetical protein